MIGRKETENKAKDKIFMMNIASLKIDRDFKSVFQQETEKVIGIANDMKLHGFDKTRPIIITDENIIVDGHSRFMAAKKAGLKKVPVMFKKFNSKAEAIEYEYKMQLNSRRLTDGEYFDAFLRLDDMRRKNTNIAGNSDEIIGRQLNKSARQICKMREIAKKATPELLMKIRSCSVSINKAYEMVKSSEQKKKAASSDENNDDEAKVSNTGKGINSDSFKLGVLFVLSELSKGKKKSQILKDKRIARLGVKELNLGEEDLKRISNRFGIA